MDDLENERRLREKYPLHIVLMVRAAVAAMDDGRARIDDGMLIIEGEPPIIFALQSRDHLRKMT